MVEKGFRRAMKKQKKCSVTYFDNCMLTQHEIIFSTGKSCDAKHLQGCYYKAMFLYTAAQEKKEANRPGDEVLSHFHFLQFSDSSVMY